MVQLTVGQIPPESVLDKRDVSTAWFSDSYQAKNIRTGMSVVDLFQAIFGHSPGWIKALLLLRNRLAKRAGLIVPPDAAIRSFDRKADYSVGDTIGPWPIYHLSETELVAGRDNRHLNFRVSVIKLNTNAPTVAVSTICNVHNNFGKAYLFVIVPFHRWGMRHLMRRAIAGGRL